MAHGLNSVLKRGAAVGCKSEGKSGGGIGSRRIFAPHFKLQVLDSYRNDADCKGNQRATARKYGIHRRQIQKWLQVENNLRNSVGNKEQPEAALKNSTRLRDAEEARVPPSPPAPLDFTTHSRAASSSPAPIDLSLKRPAASAPATTHPPSASVSPLRDPSSSPSLAHHQTHCPDVWDLSTKRMKYEDTAISTTPDCVSAPTKPVKLFKPYLDDDGVNDTATTIVVQKQKSSDVPPCCSFVNCDATYYYNNNNNVICDSTYTLHELQPKNSVSYYYTFPSPYQGPEYEMGSFCGGGYEEPGYTIHGMLPLKQRHSYSLDFKLSAIECYYQDSICKGNQRAVASKYNIHRRQVQKWLKQADELKQKNEIIKQTQTVR